MLTQRAGNLFHLFPEVLPLHVAYRHVRLAITHEPLWVSPAYPLFHSVGHSDHFILAGAQLERPIQEVCCYTAMIRL